MTAYFKEYSFKSMDSGNKTQRFDVSFEVMETSDIITCSLEMELSMDIILKDIIIKGFDKLRENYGIKELLMPC